MHSFVSSSDQEEETVVCFSQLKYLIAILDIEILLQGEAVTTFIGHTQCVSSVVWPEEDVIYSCSWDHSVRRWDVPTGKDTLNLYCGKALNTVDVGGEGSALVAGGGSDPVLRVWDPRKPGEKSIIRTYTRFINSNNLITRLI